jgi:hypothetical protein
MEENQKLLTTENENNQRNEFKLNRLGSGCELRNEGRKLRPIKLS